MNIVPVLLVKNEELWIERVLTPLVNVFPHVIVSDTGSTDSTETIIQDMRTHGANIVLNSYPDLKPAQLGKCRQDMQDQARALFDATHIFLVDGDELYPTKYLRFIQEFPMPENALSGFTSGKEIRELPNGELWYLRLNGSNDDIGLNRQAIISVDSRWSGEYPFESPSTYKPGDPTNYYWKPADPTCHFFHLHQTIRSNKDEDVYIRMKKRHQLSMRDTPDVSPGRLWLKSREEYIDE
jgi:glycosyltransferase involved in cell wall biosynthesis